MFIIELIIEMEISIFIFIGKINEFLLEIEIWMKFYIFLFKIESKMEVKDVLILKR